MEVGLAAAGRCRAARTESAATVAPGGFATAGVAHTAAAPAPLFIVTAFFARIFCKAALFADSVFASDFLGPEVRAALTKFALITSATQKRAGSPTLTRTGNTIC